MGGIEAQAGFYYQNVLGALRALDLIELGSPLLSVSFDNPALADSIDDIVAEAKDFTEFVQVKWAQDSDTSFTFANLTSAEDGPSDSLLAKLAAGFRKIQNMGGAKRVVLHSTKRAGVSAQPAKGFSKSLAEFIDEFHVPFRDDTLNQELEKAKNYASYREILDSLFKLTGFTDRSSFAAFLKSLRFDLSQPDRDSLVLRLKMRLEKLGIGERQAGVLTNKVVEWSIDKVIVRADDVLRELGLNDHYVDSLKQNFPIDIERIVPVPAVVEAIDEALDALPSGYILLEGEPGVGKSTALSTLRAYRRDVTLEYFCFIPNEYSMGNRRMDGAAFIRSICIGLKNAFPDVDLPQTFAEFTKATLDDWLNFLSRQGLRVIIVVDGLDHVDSKHREGVLTNPLTNVLDGTLPPGVFLILGSQYIEALPSGVQDQIRSDQRRLIKVRRFDPPQIEEFFRRRHIQLSAENLILAEEASGGVPIYLEYLANTLADLTEYEQERLLKSVPSIRDKKIDAYHNHLWHAIEHDSVAVSILALLAIRQDFTTADDLVDLLTIMKLSPTRLSVESSLKTIRHVLRISDARGYAIRHESFRLFVEEKTASLTPLLNTVLNQWYADHPNTNEAWRHRFRHLYELGLHKELLDACDGAWLRRSWSQFRPFAEINENIDYAWRAASDLRDLTQFVRVALMRQRVGLVRQNLSKDEAEIALFLLELERPQEALLRVWDGDRAICGQVAFAQFCLYHKKLIGRPPSPDVMRQGLGESLTSGLSPNTHETYYRACAYASDPVSLLVHVDGLLWKQSDKSRSQVKHLDSQQSAAVNGPIERGIVDELYEKASTLDLLHISEESTLSAEIREYARLAAVAVIAKNGEGKEAQRLLDEQKPDLLPLTTIARYLIELAEAGIDISAVNGPSEKPSIPLTLIDTSATRLNEDVFEVYDRLRLFCLADPTAIPWLETRVSDLPSDLSALLLAFGELAKFWSDRIPSRPTAAPQTASALFEVARGLLRVRLYLRGRNSYIYLYDPELPTFLKPLWNEVAIALSQDQLVEFAHLWENLRAESGMHPPAQATRDLAVALSSQLPPKHEVVAALLRMAEQDSRAEEETAVLTSELLATASAWGRSGFPEDALRLWEELLDVGCGIYYRKDYQFNEVLLPMKLAHEQDPSGTLDRISEQLTLVHQLEDAARGKTVAVAIEELIMFAVRVSPALSLRMLEREQSPGFRGRMIESLVRKLAEDSSIDPLLLWSLVSTMNIWEDYREFNDETLPAMKAVFQSCVERHMQPATEILFLRIRHLLLVQKNLMNELGAWANIWVEAGDAPDWVIADRDQYNAIPLEHKSEDLSASLLEPPDTAKLDEAVSRGITEIERELDALEDQALDNARHRELERLKRDWEQNIASSLKRNLTDDEDGIFEESFQKFEDLLVSLPETDQDSLKTAILKACNDFVSNLETRLGADASPRDFVDTFDVDDWLKQFLRKRPSRFSTEQVLERRISEWVANAKLKDLPLWADFCRRRCWGQAKAKALSAIAKRYKALEPQEALRLLIEAWKSSSEFFFMYTDVARTILSDAIALDREVGVKLLFDSFREQHERYPENIVHQLEEVVRFADQFSGTDFVKLYGVWSEYNRNLTYGLSKKPVDVSWLKNELPDTFLESCIAYLVGMLDYPDVDIRLRATDACYDLLATGTAQASAFVSGWSGLNLTQKEHLTSLLFSHGFAQPEKMHEWCSPLLLRVGEETHFNIRCTASEMISAVENVGTILPAAVHDQAVGLRDRQTLATPIQTTVHIPGKNRIPCLPYTCYLLNELKNIAPEDIVVSRLFSFVLKDFGEPVDGFEQERRIHLDHNINTNFDNIEISGRYDQSVRSGINVVLEELVRTGQIDHKEATRLGTLLRVEDPTDRLIATVEKPSRIDWIDANLSADDFKNFADWDAITARLRNQTKNWITLFEETEQRLAPGMGSGPSRATRVKTSLFYAPSGQRGEDLGDLRELQPTWMDLYRFELRALKLGPKRLRTLQERGAFSQVVMRSFRGRIRSSIAALRRDLAEGMNMEQDPTDYFGYRLSDKPAVRSTEWQGAIDQGRRRHEPISSGFLLEIDKNVLRDWAEKHRSSLWLEVEVERTVDRYSPESEMDWKSRTELIEVTLA